LFWIPECSKPYSKVRQTSGITKQKFFFVGLLSAGIIGAAAFLPPKDLLMMNKRSFLLGRQE
jgi:hypothetical protein